MLHYDEVKLPTASGNLSSNFADSPNQRQLFQTPGRDATADVTYHDSLARFDSKYVGRVHAHIRTPNNDRFHIRQRPRERGHKCPSGRLLDCEVLITL